MPHSHIPIMFNFILHVCTIFSHGIDVPAGVGAPPLNTTTVLLLDLEVVVWSGCKNTR